MSQAVIKSLFAQRSRDFLKDVLSRYTDAGPKAPDILLVVKTTHPGVVLPDYLKEEYPEAIHLVFGGYSENLMLGEAGFDVTLSFGDGYEDLSIPFDAIEGLVCQEEGFALQLPSLTDDDDETTTVPLTPMQTQTRTLTLRLAPEMTAAMLARMRPMRLKQHRVTTWSRSTPSAANKPRPLRPVRATARPAPILLRPKLPADRPRSSTAPARPADGASLRSWR